MLSIYPVYFYKEKDDRYRKQSDNYQKRNIKKIENTLKICSQKHI